MHERDIFLAAIEFTDPVERSAYVDQACAGDEKLRAQVKDLLNLHAQTSKFLETPAIAMNSVVEHTVITDSTADKADANEQSSSGEADFRKYLQPATRPGWLGRLAHYEIEEILGRGAFGIVAKAFDEKLHRVVAIKLMSPDLATTSPPRKRFLREARTAAAVTHENIVAIHAVEEDPIPYLVMEFIPGQTLQKRMEEHGPLDLAEVLRIGQQVAAGLAAAHAANLIHRDIKPANILLTGGIKEKAKISDFGLARAVDDATMTSSGVIAGTPLYMAPEQARGEPLDHRVDLFSLGSVLYQMVCGRPPFRAANTVAVLKRVCEDTPRPLDDVIPETPDWLEAIIFRLLEKQRDDRYQTAQEVADLLARCQNELQLTGKVTCVPVPSQAAQGTANPPTSAVPTPVVVPPQVGRSSAAPTSRQPLKYAAVAVASLMVGLALAELTGITSFLRKPASDHQPVVSGDTKPGTQAATVQTANAIRWHGWPADAPKPAIAPFNAEQAKQHQAAWAVYLKVPVEYSNSIGMKFRLIPPGEFTMGSAPEEIEAALKYVGEDKHWQECIKSEAPQHKVILSQPIYLGVSEVTQAEYEKVMGVNPAHFAPRGAGKEAVAGLETDGHPVEMVSWNDAAEFCAKLSQQEKLKPFYFRAGETITPLDGTGYRLPCEAEWEFSCRGGSMTKYWLGDNAQEIGAATWAFLNSSLRTHPTGELQANPFGLHDVHGNVSEWVSDAWDPAFYSRFTEQPAVNPCRESTASPLHVLRGGDYYSRSALCLSSSRTAGIHSYTQPFIGFRVALSVDTVRQQLKAAQNPAPGWQGWPADSPAPAIAPFDAAQAKKHQEEWAAYLKVPVEYTNSISMKFRLIPPGEFLMGTTSEEIEAALEVAGEDEARREQINSEAPQHKVVLTKPVYIGVAEVTQTQYEQVMGANPSHFSATGEGKDLVANLETGNHPVENVSWNDAAEFCAKLSQQEELKPFYFRTGETVTPLDGTGYRLPTEAEWESACRAGTATKYWIGDKDEDLAQAGWFGANSGGRTHAAGELKANPFGLWDVHGNVWEWVQDSWDPAFYGKFGKNAAVDPFSPFLDGSPRVFRGGYWSFHPYVCRSSFRSANHPSDHNFNFGFRVSLSVAAVREAIQKSASKRPSSPTVETSGWHGWPADAPRPAIAPFDAAQAKKHQEDWAAFLKVPVEYSNSIGMKFRLIPPGEFTMGSTPEEIAAALKETSDDKHWQECIKSEAPQHKVILTQPIYLGVNEVTQAAYEKVMGVNPSHFAPLGMGKEAVAGLETTEHPVEMVCWNDAAEFCAKLSQQEKLRPFYFRDGERITPLDGTGYRLPSEAEWEFACRAGTATKYWSGDQDEDLVRAGWSGRNSGRRTHAVGELESNPFGLYDIHGNVWEWVQDGWDATWYGQFPEKPAINPSSPFYANSQRGLRCGSWNLTPSASRSSSRNAGFPMSRAANIGFRVSLPVEAVKQRLKS